MSDVRVTPLQTHGLRAVIGLRVKVLLRLCATYLLSRPVPGSASVCVKGLHDDLESRRKQAQAGGGEDFFALLSQNLFVECCHSIPRCHHAGFSGVLCVSERGPGLMCECTGVAEISALTAPVAVIT